MRSQSETTRRYPQAAALFDAPVLSGTVTIVVVCTANQARSPLIERLLRSELDALAPGAFRVQSCGTRAVAGRPMADGAARILRSRGVPSDGFASTPMSEHILRDADLVLTAEARHSAAVIDAVPALLKKTFTFLEFTRIATLRRLDGTNARAVISSASLLRSAARGAPDVSLDLADPVGNDPMAFVALERQLGESAGTVARALAGAL